MLSHSGRQTLVLGFPGTTYSFHVYAYIMNAEKMTICARGPQPCEVASRRGSKGAARRGKRTRMRGGCEEKDAPRCRSRAR